ncbi:MAG: TerB family tellurite resistance protein [Methyloligellaceae bacterium]
MSADAAALRCPHCDRRAMETVATLPYTRGFLLDPGFGVKTIAGCVPCARRAVLAETGQSALIGWFSLAGLIANPVFITYGLARALFLTHRPERVAKLMHSAGMSGPGTPAPVDAAYRLAASMIAADARIEQAEITVACEIGGKLFDAFSADVFRKVVANHPALPGPEELALLLKSVLDKQDREDIFQYLIAIAAADGEMAKEEQDLLARIAENLGLNRPGQGIDQSA